MVQKIIDIIPPGKKEPTPVPQPSVEIKRVLSIGEERVIHRPVERKSFPVAEEREIKFSSPRASRKGILILVLLALVTVGAGCYFTLSKADIFIWPETEIKNLEIKATIDKSVSDIDVSNALIPGKIFEVEKTVLQEFPSTGKITKEVKAEGIIRVYNNYSSSQQILIANTRFMSVEGKLFRSVERITVPGGTIEKGKVVTPGYVDAKVRADKAGPEYNIDASTFSIPGFVGTDKYTKFYGKSTEPMKGGEARVVPQVTAEDLERAKTSVTDEALKECKEAIKSEILQDFILPDNSLKTDIVETFSLAAPKAELEKFSYQVKARSTALAFKKTDMDNFVKAYIIQQIDYDKKINEESLEVNYSVDTVDFNTGKITVSIQARAKIYSDIDKNSLKEGLVGKDLAETKIFLENQPQMVKSEVKFWPFWVKRVPNDLERVYLQLRFD
ncbi:MAG: hypothetical protein WC514_01800 [Candidatus Paceibacterota bacterium]